MSNKSNLVPPDAPTAQEAAMPIKLEQLSSVPAISALGLVAARVLQQHGIVTLMISAEGVVELVPVGELELDLLPDHSALSALVQRGYTDQQLADYLRQREIRQARLDNNTSTQEHR